MVVNDRSMSKYFETARLPDGVIILQETQIKRAIGGILLFYLYIFCQSFESHTVLLLNRNSYSSGFTCFDVLHNTRFANMCAGDDLALSTVCQFFV
jgi:hypothetical protein